MNNKTDSHRKRKWLWVTAFLVGLTCIPWLVRAITVKKWGGYITVSVEVKSEQPIDRTGFRFATAHDQQTADWLLSQHAVSESDFEQPASLTPLELRVMTTGTSGVFDDSYVCPKFAVLEYKDLQTNRTGRKLLPLTGKRGDQQVIATLP